MKYLDKYFSRNDFIKINKAFGIDALLLSREDWIAEVVERCQINVRSINGLQFYNQVMKVVI